MINDFLEMIANGQQHHPVVMLFPFLIFAIFILIVLQFKTGVRKELNRIASGSAAKPSKSLNARQLEKRLQNIKSACCQNGTVFGVNQVTGKPVVLFDHDANLHTLAIGTTGSGKTTALTNFVESAIQKRWPLFYVDGKGDLALAQSISNFAKANNVPCYIFSMIGES